MIYHHTTTPHNYLPSLTATFCGALKALNCPACCLRASFNARHFVVIIELISELVAAGSLASRMGFIFDENCTIEVHMSASVGRSVIESSTKVDGFSSFLLRLWNELGPSTETLGSSDSPSSSSYNTISHIFLNNIRRTIYNPSLR